MWIFQTQRGHGRTGDGKQSEANVVITKTTAITSTVTSNHTTLGPVISIEVQMQKHPFNLYHHKYK